jgi:uncharacterized protein YjbI with pentapeptide repeats
MKKVQFTDLSLAQLNKEGETFEAAVKQRASLAYADLSDKDLSNWDLRYADFRRSDAGFSGVIFREKFSLKQKLVNWLRRTFNF